MLSVFSRVVWEDCWKELGAESMHLLNLTIFIVIVTLILSCASRADNERHFILIYSAFYTFTLFLMRWMKNKLREGRGNPSPLSADYVTHPLTLNSADHQVPQ